MTRLVHATLLAAVLGSGCAATQGTGQDWVISSMIGSRILIGGVAKEGDFARTSSPLAGLSFERTFPVASRQAVGAQFLVAYSRFESGYFGEEWSLYTLGAGLKYHFLHAPASVPYPGFDLYVTTDLAYTHWRGDGSPVEDIGYTQGFGIGGDIIFSSLAFGLQAVYRYTYEATTFDGHWIDLGLVLSYRF